MAPVEEAELHELVRQDVLDEEASPAPLRLLPRRSAVGELVLDHPLNEVLADHRPLVLDAELTPQGIPNLGSRDGGDAVHLTATILVSLAS